MTAERFSCMGRNLTAAKTAVSHCYATMYRDECTDAPERLLRRPNRTVTMQGSDRPNEGLLGRPHGPPGRQRGSRKPRTLGRGGELAR